MALFLRTTPLFLLHYFKGIIESIPMIHSLKPQNFLGLERLAAVFLDSGDILLKVTFAGILVFEFDFPENVLEGSFSIVKDLHIQPVELVLGLVLRMLGVFSLRLLILIIESSRSPPPIVLIDSGVHYLRLLV